MTTVPRTARHSCASAQITPEDAPSSLPPAATLQLPSIQSSTIPASLLHHHSLPPPSIYQAITSAQSSIMTGQFPTLLLQAPSISVLLLPHLPALFFRSSPLLSACFVTPLQRAALHHMWHLSPHQSHHTATDAGHTHRFVGRERFLYYVTEQLISILQKASLM